MADCFRLSVAGMLEIYTACTLYTQGNEVGATYDSLNWGIGL